MNPPQRCSLRPLAFLRPGERGKKATEEEAEDLYLIFHWQFRDSQSRRITCSSGQQRVTFTFRAPQFYQPPSLKLSCDLHQVQLQQHSADNQAAGKNTMTSIRKNTTEETNGCFVLRHQKNQNLLTGPSIKAVSQRGHELSRL